MRLVANTAYNEVGQLRTKKLHSTDSVNYLQTIFYTYNERGWLRIDSSRLFAMRLDYNTGTNKQYNGNIAYQYWGVPGNLNNHYTYTYDKLNRLSSGITSLDNYQESGITYDLMSNITALNRYQAGTQVDQLGYTYTGNQLQSVADANASNSGLVSGTTNYTYDGNGNMLSAANTVNTQQNKSFSYNLLNLPLVVTVPTGTATYTYDAAGNKLRKVDVRSGVTTSTDYIGGIQYDGTNTTDTLSFIQTEEGRAVHNGAIYDYQYFLGDNLGNTRVTFNTKTGSAKAIQNDDYYPFGLRIVRGNTPTPKNNYLYNKKELQEEFAEYDYGARFYDPVIGRWNTIDPLAEISRRWSTYNYVENNPIRLIDPDGMWTELPDGSGVTTTDPTEIAQFVAQEQARAVVNIGLAFAGFGGQKGGGTGNSAGGPPKDGDRNKKGEIYSEFLKTWVPEATYREFKQIEYNLKQRQYQQARDEKAWENFRELMKNGGKSIATGMLIYAGGEYLWEVFAPSASSVLYTIGSKIAGQMATRGWTEEAIEEVMSSPSQVGTTINRATGNAATAFVDDSGAYVVKDNVTNEIIQISNRNDPNWIMDSSIKIKPTL